MRLVQIGEKSKLGKSWAKVGPKLTLSKQLGEREGGRKFFQNPIESAKLLLFFPS